MNTVLRLAQELAKEPTPEQVSPGFAGFLAQVGMPEFMAVPVILIEALGGVAIVLGVYSRWVAALTIPVLLMWGAKDSGVSLDRSLLLLEALPGAELHIFNGAAHWVQWDQADRFNSIVRDFLKA